MGAAGSTPGAGTTTVQRDPRAGRGDRGDWDNQGCSGGSPEMFKLQEWQVKIEGGVLREVGGTIGCSSEGR